MQRVEGGGWRSGQQDVFIRICLLTPQPVSGLMISLQTEMGMSGLMAFQEEGPGSRLCPRHSLRLEGRVRQQDWKKLRDKERGGMKKKKKKKKKGGRIEREGES